jgi:omega-amidase
MKIAVAQIKVNDGSFGDNSERGLDAIHKASSRGAELVILPELWSSGYDLENAEKYSDLNKDLMKKVSELCRKYRIICVAGSFIIKNNRGELENRLFVFDRKGSIAASYSKMHLFPGLKENIIFKRGETPRIYSSPWGDIGLALCFDLRFPELFRYYFQKKASIIVIPAQWPHVRIDHWKCLLRARAIENACYVLSCNAAGRPEDNSLFGYSSIIDPQGNIIAETSQEEGIIQAELDLSKCTEAVELLQLRKSCHPKFC